MNTKYSALEWLPVRMWRGKRGVTAPGEVLIEKNERKRAKTDDFEPFYADFGDVFEDLSHFHRFQANSLRNISSSAAWNEFRLEYSILARFSRA